MIEHALKYAAAGIAVFPLQVRGKMPAISKDDGGHGCLDATTDDAIIAEWWERMPNANIGIATGPASGLLVVDLDGDTGVAVWASIVADEDIKTARARTADGQHLYFKSSLTVGNTAKRIGPGIDTRGKGGYVVAPPSIHPSGARYSWLNREKPAQLPDWLAEAIQALKPEPSLEPIVRRRDPSGDPLLGIDPPAYVWLLTGRQVNRSGKTPCMLPGHEGDWEGDGGSFHAYPENGWYCYGCGRGGDIYTLAKALWGDQDTFPDLRKRLIDAVLGTRA